MLNQRVNESAQKLYINNGIPKVNPWVLLEEATQVTRIAEQSGLPIIKTPESETHLLVKLDHWPELAKTLEHQQKPYTGLIVDGFAELEYLQDRILETEQELGLTPDALFIDFPVFTDGQGYSLAHLLLRSGNPTLKLGAIGDILQDQIFFYRRCGFEFIIPRHDQKIENCTAQLQAFSAVYQPAHFNP